MFEFLLNTLIDLTGGMFGLLDYLEKQRKKFIRKLFGVRD